MMGHGPQAGLESLQALLGRFGRVAVAVSGGVDSLTLAAAAHGRLSANATMFHAVSPAVPPEATLRTRELAQRLDWQLEVIEAGEFSDPDYLRNPVNRCYFCKSSLYRAIARRSKAVIVSGTNLDDLQDFRPGLEAAAQLGVRHPFVECGIGKAAIRALASVLGLGGIAELPASPCLSSRLETGIRVTAASLSLVHAVEGLIERSIGAHTVRCRIRDAGVFVELDQVALARATGDEGAPLRERIEALCAARGRPGPVRYAPYRTGSAFLRNVARAPA